VKLQLPRVTIELVIYFSKYCVSTFEIRWRVNNISNMDIYKNCE